MMIIIRYYIVWNLIVIYFEVNNFFFFLFLGVINDIECIYSYYCYYVWGMVYYFVDDFIEGGFVDMCDYFFMMF